MGETLLMRQAGEPSVEEILESIKKVIARDSREEAARQRNGREEAAPQRGGRAEAAQNSGQLAAQQSGQRDRAQRERVAPPAPAVAVPQPVAAAEPAQAREAGDEAILELTEPEDSDLHDFDSFREGSLAPDRSHDEPDNLRGDSWQDEDATKPLVAETAVASMRESLAALALLSQPGVAPQIVRSGETSLEGLTRDLLRPMLADWLERNLPAMVERLVAVEIARIAGKKG